MHFARDILAISLHLCVYVLFAGATASSDFSVTKPEDWLAQEVEPELADLDMLEANGIQAELERLKATLPKTKQREFLKALSKLEHLKATVPKTEQKEFLKAISDQKEKRKHEKEEVRTHKHTGAQAAEAHGRTQATPRRLSDDGS